MKSRSFVVLYCSLAATYIFLFATSSKAETKQIHLRNETILTHPATAAPAAAQAQVKAKNVSGLFLVQFEDHPKPEWIAELKAAGVDLLRYVPDDAFVAKFENTQLTQVEALSFVRYVGPFRPDHKVHSALAAAAKDAVKTNGFVTVAILISPRATSTEITEVRALFAAIHHESHLRQGTVMRGIIAATRLDALAQSDAVLWLERAAKHKLIDETASKLVGGDDGQTGTPTVTQQLGFNGAGVTVAVADTGLDFGTTNNMHPDLAGRVSSFIFYPPLADAADEHSHGTHVAGIVAGNAATGETDDSGAFYGLGVASGATLVIERIFDGDGNEVDPPPSDQVLARDAVRAGAKIGSNSWGNDVQGAYDLDASSFDELVRDADASSPGDQPYILEFSAGNAGPDSQTLDSPASAKNVIATGASENGGQLDFGLYDDGPDTMADFSSRGPSEDGRIKPDLVAPGTFVASLLSGDASSDLAWLPIDNFYIYMGGTSQAGPHASGAAAVFVQYYKSLHTNAVPSPALVKAALINSATELDESNGGPGPIPNNDEGWGRITLTNIIGSPRVTQFLDQTVLLTNGQIFEQHSFVQDSSQPLKITVAYTDVAGFPGALPALVNDLDLEVVGPDGTLYRGNQFSGGESVPNANLADRLNNVEAVHLSQPLPGDYLVRVRAHNIVEDARLDTQAIDQDFALVVSGDIAQPHAGLILLDRTAYSVPGTMQIQVLDAGRAGNNSVTVSVKSTTESSGENYVLPASGNYGAFSGAVAVVAGNALADGKLEVHGGDSITATYVDSSGATHIANAVADTTPPTISGVTESVDLGVITISWQTSELANSIVRYSTNFAFNLAVTNSTLTTQHSVRLSNLIAGKTYNFFVTSSDAAGNLSTNNNSGTFYNFVAVPTPNILFVDAYEQADGSAFIPQTTYTTALNASGFTYATWSVSDRGSPQLADLQPFKAIVWRLTDDEINYDGTNNTFSAPQQFMIENYLNGGGAFFTASMGLLGLLGDVPFRHDVLQVSQFVSNPDAPLECDTCDEDFGVPAILGASNDVITAGMNVALDYSQYPSFDFGLGDTDSTFGPDFSDVFTLSNNATPICFESISGKVCGMRYPRTGQDSPGRVVFLSFPLDTVPQTGASPNNETALLHSILAFLLPGANGVGTIALDGGAYNVPSQVSVEVADSDLSGLGNAQVTFSTTSSTNKVTTTLTESTHPGVFRGGITLVAAITAGATNQLAVKNGDTVTAKYFDASNNSNVVATAVIDTTPPVISQVAAVPAYNQATVTWTTSKAADSSSLAGVSVLLDHSAFSPTLVTSHAVTVNGLTANKTYFYEVTSRDAAGNTATDDNHGNFYTFQTLAAPRPPWSDDLESGAPGWTVVTDPAGPSDINWTLGTPNNGLVTKANSETHAWGSDINGKLPNSFDISTYLLSPFIDLSGLSHATLTFWDVFDFSLQTSFEQGQLMILTNSSVPLGSLPAVTYPTSSSALDWQQETVDLTPYIGQTIQVVWYYLGVSFDSPLYGWLVDDISITGTQAGAQSGGGTIVISKNLGQGGYALTGPLNQTGSTILTTISNAPVGQYTIAFDDVAFYQTPAQQTATLAASNTLVFAGNYTFTDANHNGISDEWEQFYFGSVSTNRTSGTDTDHDGMTDLAEFIAGTNPNDPASKLVFLPPTVQTNGTITLKWPAIPGRLYQLESSTNASIWLPATDWLPATASPMSFKTTNSHNGFHLYRVQVKP